MSAVATSPATLFGGTWVEWGTGRVPVAIDTSQTEFDTVEKTGGAKTHTLTAAEMPIHSHATTTDTAAKALSTTTSGAEAFGAAGTNNYRRTASLSANATGNAGGGGAHNNLQPYITCYMWKRTA